jgi:hypothetical protein
MISRSTSLALAFALLATLSVTVAAKVLHAPTPAQATAPMAVIDMPRVVITGQVARDASR